MTDIENMPQSLVRARVLDGPSIWDIEGWQRLAGPKSPEIHWKDFRSAKELARSWLRNGPPTMPVEYSELLESSGETRGFHPVVAYAEAEIAIDDYFGPRNSDLIVVGDAKRGRVCLAVEAKADESFAGPIEKELSGLSEASAKPDRVTRLANAVFQRDVDEHVKTLRYQLLHSLAATVIEARCWNARIGVLLVHEFISLKLDFEKVVVNSIDLEEFVNTIPGWENESVTTGKLLPPIFLKGNQHVPSDQLVTIGKVRTLIPLDAEGRARASHGFNPDNKQFLVASPSTIPRR